MNAPASQTTIADTAVLERTARRLREAGIILPTFAQLADPSCVPPSILDELTDVDPDEPHPRNLFRIHWYNARDRRRRAAVPEHIVLPKSITGVEADILVAQGDRFPLIGAHKVLAAYACLVPRLVTGRFDPTIHRAVWPSTGNYCRGGVAVSRILGCKGVAILPAGMSAERFAWLERVMGGKDDIVKTPGVESDVAAIYDACAELEAASPQNIILNQFSEFPNHLAHYLCTGKAMADIYEVERSRRPDLRLRAFVSATGSAGTIAAGDYLKERYGSITVAAEALECPTMLYNGFGAHNIQGIGDKHIPLIHNVMNTDIVTAVSDAATDSLFVLFSHPAGRDYLKSRREVPVEVIDALGAFGFSGFCNVIAAIKTAKKLGLSRGDAILTVATDGAGLYESEIQKILEKRFGGRFDSVRAGEIFAEHLEGASESHTLELAHDDRTRIFNLGYFTWVEQRGVSIEQFEARRSLTFWTGLRDLLSAWDVRIEEMNLRAHGPLGG
ncbi:MAG: pyridoxal-5'-phosphate-dependent protein subunit beta [Polyangiaceae bacterium]|nr:pyridoxal-5'-phosphate-dependent protein subunit beta [Polyangiaceae bacterium]